MKLTFNKPQCAYLSSTADILLYGGAAGSGKSYVAIVDLLGLNESPTPRYKLSYYRALIYRKRRGDLADLIDKSKKIYPLVDPGAVFNNTDTFWTFSSGAKIYFKYFERIDQAESWLQGQELACICVEEIGQYENDKIFKYALSRLRSSEGLKCYMRATCNPSKYKWLRKYFRIDDVGTATDFFEEFELGDGTKVKKRIKFIPAKLSDNPHLPKEYEAQLMLLPEDERNALLNGAWNAYDSVEGQVYELELKQLDEQKRHCAVPYDPVLDVYTFWDIGISDNCVILFVQYCGKEVRIIDAIEENNKGVQDYIATIKRYESDKGYRYAKHLLPHDGSAREKFSGKSILEQFEQYYKNVECLPRLPIADGIFSTKQMFPRLWVDNRTSVIDRLRNYRRVWNERLQEYGDPLHDINSHMADAVRYVSYYTPTQSTHRIAPKRPFRGSF